MPADITRPHTEVVVDRLTLHSESLSDFAAPTGADPTWLGCFWSAFAED
ncbi:MAG TPA: hypothetical protein VIG24_08205 [Acidimicrobiia bacterium]